MASAESLRFMLATGSARIFSERGIFNGAIVSILNAACEWNTQNEKESKISLLRQEVL